MRSDYRRVKGSGGRIYILPGNSGHVWRQSTENGEVWISFYRGRIRPADTGMPGILWLVCRSDQVPDGLYQEA